MSEESDCVGLGITVSGQGLLSRNRCAPDSQASVSWLECHRMHSVARIRSSRCFPCFLVSSFLDGWCVLLYMHYTLERKIVWKAILGAGSAAAIIIGLRQIYTFLDSSFVCGLCFAIRALLADWFSSTLMALDNSKILQEFVSEMYIQKISNVINWIRCICYIKEV